MESISARTRRAAWSARLAMALLALAAAASACGAPPASRPAAGPPAAPARGSIPAAPDVASYVIEATLSADGTSVRGTERVRYRNVSSDALGELYFHLYLNAFRSADTLWMREARAGRAGTGFDPAAPGWIRVESALVDGAPARLDLDESETMGRLALPRPLGPGEEVALDLAWTAQLPRVFARTGWAPGGFTMVGQWYPKLAVYDPRRGGWDREPWHANAEFFHDFGSYELTLSVPAERTVVATGEPVGPPRDEGDGTRVWRFRASSVTDVAWMAAEQFAVEARPLGGVMVEVALPRDLLDQAERYFEVADYALRRYGEWLGPYPWPRLAIVVPPPAAEGAAGMEYPMLVASLAVPSPLSEILRLAEVVTAHEIAHEWFPMQVATDEARDPWLDEGLAEYLTDRLVAERYGAGRSLLDLPFAQLGYRTVLRAEARPAARLPVTRPAWQYHGQEYGAAVYGKGSMLFATLEAVFGPERFTRALRAYVEQWRWQHPTAGDFQQALEAALGPEVNPWLDQLAFGERLLEVEAAEATSERALVRRTGDAALPVAGVLALESGARLDWTLAPSERDLELAAPEGERIVAVLADPQRALAIEPDQLDDGLLVEPQTGTLTVLAARWLEALAVWLQVVGQFG